MEIILVSIGIVAKMFGVTTQTIRNWTKQGVLKEYRTIGSHRRYDLKEVKKLTGEIEEEKKTIIYSRVSSYDQKNDLERQTKELEKYCENKEFEAPEVIEDIGSGINYKKKGLKKLIKDVIMGKVKRIVVSFEDRLLRFGIELLSQICEIMGVEIIITNEQKNKSSQERFVEDVLTILTVYCSKIYGSRSHKNNVPN